MHPASNTVIAKVSVTTNPDDVAVFTAIVAALSKQ
jgi:hypothetical protein